MEQEEQIVNVGDIYDQIKKRVPSKALGLIHNPFPPTGIAGIGEGAFPFFPRSVYTNALTGFVKSALQGNDFCGLVIIGEYGSGKTSLLRHFARAVSIAQGSGVPVSTVYVSNPGTSFADILQSMIRSIGREVLVKYAWALFIKWLKSSTGGTHFTDIGLPVPSKEQLVSLNDAGSFWGVYDRELITPRSVVAEAVNNAMVQILPDLYFSQDLAKMMLGDRSTVSQTWSQFSRPPTSSSVKKPVAAERMASIMEVFKANGIDHLFLLIDEFEDVAFTRMSKTKRDDFTAILRAIINDQGTNLSMVLASNLPGWSLLIRSDASLEDRFKFRVELNQLDDQEVFQLVNKYILRAKDSTSEIATQFFSEKLTNLIAKSRHRMPRPVLITFHAIVEHFWDFNYVPTIPEVEECLANIQ